MIFLEFNIDINTRFHIKLIFNYSLCSNAASTMQNDEKNEKFLACVDVQIIYLIMMADKKKSLQMTEDNMNAFLAAGNFLTAIRDEYQADYSTLIKYGENIESFMLRGMIPQVVAKVKHFANMHKAELLAKE